MSDNGTLGSLIEQQGLDRREFLKFCASVVALFSLPVTSVPTFAQNLKKAQRLPVIWLSFQECTGCTESLTRAFAPTIEDLIFNFLSLDYHHTLQAVSGEAAEAARLQTMKQHHGSYLLIVDGSVPTGLDGAYSTIAGMSNLAMLRETIEGAVAVIAMGSCASYGGLAKAKPNPTGAMGVDELMSAGMIAKKPLVNTPGCPPMPVAITGTLAYYLAFKRLPLLDEQKRPEAFYHHTVHEQCYRYHFFVEGKFAKSFDDEGTRKGWCLYELGCRGPVTHNACAKFKWNGGTSFPVESGHPCLGCSEPNFWDSGSFYQKVDETAMATVLADTENNQTQQAGRELYEENCIYCHSANPNEFQTEPDAVKDLLKAGKIRSHRRFDFTDNQLDELQAYLEQKAKEQ